ncbi:MAG: YifB family Mg chelatase-like AAA ATPase [Clostridia bacterium]|nr:YifB family Mg chelatase-like AAA ATPase [Clostridia bacterium]
MAVVVNSIGYFGLHTFPVEVEADVSFAKFKFDIVGLPDTAVSESRERVRSAIKNSGYDFPNTHITVNLAPADVRKEGPVYDLPIFIALLKATKQLRADLRGVVFAGELSLSGCVRPINGVLPMVMQAKESGFHTVFIPAANACEAAVVEGINVFAVKHVDEVIAHLNGSDLLLPIEHTGFHSMQERPEYLDFADVKGQENAKRAVELAAAGGHNLLMIGSPGSGKSMLAKRIPSILPDLTFEEALETTKIYSIAGELQGKQGLLTERPFRSPHHSVSAAGLAGGGAVPKPGEISLANNGVLFLDELPEFSRQAMEIMRQPLEDGEIHISRVFGTLTYPSSVMLVAAMNPCPCGYKGHPKKQCTCTKFSAERYIGKVSGPLLDRIDIHIEVEPVEYRHLRDNTPGESSATIRERVERVRAIQRERFAGTSTLTNARMTPAQTRQFCVLTDAGERMMRDMFETLNLSARAYDKVLHVARTIADLEGAELLTEDHIFEAVQYRSLDRKFWQT